MYRWNFLRDSAGTDALRKTIEIMEALRPDVAIASEWDDQNENTSFRSTMYNSISTQRITRSTVQKLQGKGYFPIPDDNTEVPNLIVSTRQSLAAGERFEVEVTNVPDGTFSGETFRVECVLKDIEGNVVMTFPPAKLAAAKMGAHRFTVSSVELLKHQVLIPFITVQHSKGSWSSESVSLAPVEIRGNRNLNYKWILQPLRNLPRGIEGSLEIVNRNPDGSMEIKGRISSPGKLRTVELHDGADPVYMESPAVMPSDPATSVYTLVAIDEDYNVYRGRRFPCTNLPAKKYPGKSMTIFPALCNQ